MMGEHRRGDCGNGCPADPGNPPAAPCGISNRSSRHRPPYRGCGPPDLSATPTPSPALPRQPLRDPHHRERAARRRARPLQHLRPSAHAPRREQHRHHRAHDRELSELDADIEQRPEYVSVVTEAATPVWLLQAFTEARELRVSTVNPRPTPANSSYELWMLPGGGANPVSLGLLPETGDARLGLSAAQLGVLTRTMTLAVSVEPAGGSPTGLPTGPVILTAPLIRS